MDGAGVGSTTASAGRLAGMASAAPSVTRTRTRTRTTALSRRFRRMWRDQWRTTRRPALLDDEGNHREQHEQREQQDGELPESALDAPPAAVDGRVTAERARQPGPAGLQQDGGDERDAQQDLADGQDRIHGL